MDQQFVELAGSGRPRKRAAERIGDVDPGASVAVTLTLRGPELPELDAGGPPLSRAELESAYGADPKDIALVSDTLEGLGLTVEATSQVGRSVRARGTAAQMEQAFSAGLGMYRSAEGHEFRGREESLRVPAQLDGIVTGVFGLDQRRVAHRGIGGLADAQGEAVRAAPLGPADLESRYSFPESSGKGQRIAIAEFGGTYFPDDLAKFCALHQLSVPSVEIVDAGLRPVEPAEIGRLAPAERKEVLEASGEVMMDIEIVAGLCPDAEILVYFAHFDERGWIDLLNEVIAAEPAARVLSVSWGLAEDSPEWSPAAIEEIEARLQAAAQMGITVCVASGDDGSGDQVEDGKAHVNFPASSPSVLSVGGTMLDCDSEVVWWQSPGERREQGGATGGGVSALFGRPPWQDVQVTSLNEGSIDGRVVPDITALAGPPYYDLVVLGERQASGGTSAAAPLWAALLVRMLAAGKPAQPVFFAPLLYQRLASGEARGQATCTDITEGDNTSSPSPGVGYRAGPGYDAASGWGAPVGRQLLSSLS
jgi:kumamolisin